MVLPKGIVSVGAYIHAIAIVHATQKGSLAAEGGILKCLYIVRCLDLKLRKIEMF